MIHTLWNLRTVISDALHRIVPLCSSFSPPCSTFVLCAAWSRRETWFPGMSGRCCNRGITRATSFQGTRNERGRKKNVWIFIFSTSSCFSFDRETWFFGKGKGMTFIYVCLSMMSTPRYEGWRIFDRNFLRRGGKKGQDDTCTISIYIHFLTGGN